MYIMFFYFLLFQRPLSHGKTLFPCQASGRHETVQAGISNCFGFGNSLQFLWSQSGENQRFGRQEGSRLDQRLEQKVLC